MHVTFLSATMHLNTVILFQSTCCRAQARYFAHHSSFSQDPAKNQHHYTPTQPPHPSHSLLHPLTSPPLPPPPRPPTPHSQTHSPPQNSLTPSPSRPTHSPKTLPPSSVPAISATPLKLPQRSLSTFVACSLKRPPGATTVVCGSMAMGRIGGRGGGVRARSAA